MSKPRKFSQSLSETIEELRQSERAFYKRRDRYWAQHYLAEVYEVLQSLSDDQVDELCEGDWADELDATSRLMKLTSKAGPKTISRWVQALTYVHDIIEERGGKVEVLLRRLGGISGAARAEANPRKAAGEKRRDW